MGKMLVRIHRYNAWAVIWLAVTGVLLYMPGLRGLLAAVRVPLKNFHIALGVLSILILASYIHYLRRHWLTLNREKKRRITIVAALVLLLGWSLSGIILWLPHSFPATWASPALWAHDVLTWVGMPWAAVHSYVSTRRREARIRSGKTAIPLNENRIIPQLETLPQTNIFSETEALPQTVTGPQTASSSSVTGIKQTPIVSRRSFLRLGLMTATVLGLGVPVYLMFKKMIDNGGSPVNEYMARDGNSMLPVPAPAPESAIVVGGGMKGQFRVYTVTEIPHFSSATWQFAVQGLVERPMQLNWEQFLKLKRNVQVSDFHCVTGWSVTDVTWEGIPLAQLLQHAGIQSNGKYVKFYSGDGVYTDTLSLEQAMLPDVMVSVLMDGKKIPQDLGGPVRLIVPQMYAYKSVKWLTGIEVIDKPYTGYWEKRGYSNDAWVKGNS